MSTEARSRSAQQASSASAASLTPDPSQSGVKAENATNTTGTDTTQPKIRKRRLDVNPNLIISEERSKRRRTPSPDHDNEELKEGVVDPKDPERAKSLGLQIYNKIMATKDSDGESMSQPFVKLPNKRAFPDYYETIKHPMSLEIVHSRLEKAEYQTLKEVCADLGQIFNNAKRYNVKESLLFQYAKKLHKSTRVFYAKTTQPQKAHEESDSENEGDADVDAEGEPETEPEPQIELQARTQSPAKLPRLPIPAAPIAAPPVLQHRASTEGDGDVDMGGPSTASADGEESSGKAPRKRGAYMLNGPSTYKLIKPVLRAIKEARTRDGREVAAIFAQLPDRRDLPDYYKAIKNPISLEEIESKQISRRYDAWQEFFDDVELMCRNALEYNEDGSEVYRDAQQIMDLLAFHRNEVLARIAHPNAPKYKPRMSSHTPARGGYASAPYPSHLSPTPIQYSHSPGPASSYPPGPSAYPAGPPVPPTTGSYLPALPQGVVTEELVASLDRYPLYEQQAWAQSLSPLALNVYRQMLVAKEARKRGNLTHQRSPAPTAPAPSSSLPAPISNISTPLPSLPSAGRSVGQPSLPIPERQAPPVPTIKYLDFQFHSAGESPNLKQAVRLHNMRGVVTHCVILNSATSEVELTAYVADQPSVSTSSTATNGHPTTSSSSGEQNGGNSAVEVPVISPSAVAVTLPEVSLRVNGNQGSLPRFVFSSTHSDSSTDKDKENEKQPRGMRWTIQVPTTRVETKIEVVATKPGALAETSTIFVNRQL